MCRFDLLRLLLRLLGVCVVESSGGRVWEVADVCASPLPMMSCLNLSNKEVGPSSEATSRE